MVRTQAMKPAVRRPVTANFDGTTTNREDFRKWPLGDRMKPMMKDEYSPPDAPFDGLSTFKAHYTPKPIEVPRSFKPDQMHTETGPFDGNTMYRIEYVPKETEPCPAALLDTTKSNYVNTQVQDQAGHKYYRPVFESIQRLPAGGISNGVPATNKISNVSFA